MFGLALDNRLDAIYRLADVAPEHAVALLAMRMQDGKAPQIDQSYSVATGSVLPNRQFVEAVLQGQDDEALAQIPVQRVPNGTVLKIETWTERLKGNRAQMRIRSSLINRADQSIKSVRHESRAKLVRVGTGTVPVMQYALPRAEVYALEDVESTQ